MDLSGNPALCRFTEVWFGTLNGTRPPFFSLLIYTDQGDQKECAVQQQVGTPFQFTENTTAGTRYPVPGMQHNQGDIAREGSHQQQRKVLAPTLGFSEAQQSRGEQLCRRNGIEQNKIHSRGKYLVEHLRAELVIGNQFADCRIRKEQHQQGIERRTGYGLVHKFFRVKVRYRLLLKTVKLYRQKGIGGIKVDEYLTKSYILFLSIALFCL